MEARDVLWIIIGIPVSLFIIFFLIDVGISMFKRLNTFMGVFGGGKE